jgi:hypothetical protein
MLCRSSVKKFQESKPTIVDNNSSQSTTVYGKRKKGKMAREMSPLPRPETLWFKK